MTEPIADGHDCVEVVITAESAEWLADFTRSLVEDRLVACGHRIASIRAIYRWDDQIYDGPQARVGLHTRASLVPEIVARADRDHADDVPCVIALPIAAGRRWRRCTVAASDARQAAPKVTVGNSWLPSDPSEVEAVARRELEDGIVRACGVQQGPQQRPGPGDQDGDPRRHPQAELAHGHPLQQRRPPSGQLSEVPGRTGWVRSVPVGQTSPSPYRGPRCSSRVR